MVLSSTRGSVERVNSTRVEVGLMEPHANAGSSRQDSGIAEAMHPTYFEQGHHPQLVTSDPPLVEMATEFVPEQSVSRFTRLWSQFPSMESATQVRQPAFQLLPSDSLVHWKTSFISEARGTWLLAEPAD